MCKVDLKEAYYSVNCYMCKVDLKEAYYSVKCYMCKVDLKEAYYSVKCYMCKVDLKEAYYSVNCYMCKVDLKEAYYSVKCYLCKVDLKEAYYSVKCYMCKVDLKEAYYSVEVDENYQRFLKFTWRDQLYQYVCLPNSLASCPRRFTKLLNVPLSVLRLQGITLAGYIDDFFTTAPHYDSCQFSVSQVVSQFTRPGFVVHPTKSILVP